MKALITGSTGFIGSHLAEHLHAHGVELRALVRPTSDTKYLRELPIEFVQGDFGNIESLMDAVRGVDYVYHVAGVVASRTERGFFEGNQLATANLLEAALRGAPDLKRFVHVSSQAAVGPSDSEEHPVDERAPLKPITTYGRSKAAAEAEVLKRAGELPATIVRPPAVYGPRDVGVYTFFQVAARGIAPLIGFDRKLVSLVHVKDLVRGFVMAGESSVAEGETYFISSEVFYTWQQVGHVTAQVMGRKKARFIHVPHAIVYAAGGISGSLGRFSKKPPIFDFEKGRDVTRRYWTCDPSKARRDFGYRQQISIEDGVRDTVEWYRIHGWL